MEPGKPTTFITALGGKLRNRALIGFTVFAVLCADLYPMVSVYAQSSGNQSAAPKTRVLQFPDEYSAGRLRQVIINKKTLARSYEPVGPAKGAVTVPTNALLMLDVSYKLAEHLEVLKKLPADAIYCIRFDQIDTEKSLNLAGLATQKGLDELTLHHCDVEDSDLAKLSALKNLRTLGLFACGTSGSFLHELEGLHKLTEVRLGLNMLKPEAFVALGHMPQIQLLNLVQSNVDDAALAQIASIRDLTNLDIGDNRGITGQGIAHLTQCKKLRILSLCKTNLKAKDLLQLKGMKLLELRFSAAKMTQKELATLHAAFPQTFFAFDGDDKPPDKHTMRLFAPLR